MKTLLPEQILYWVKIYRKFGFTKEQILNRISYQFAKKEPILKYRPLWLLIYVTDLCNLRCKMCPHHTPGDASDFNFMKQTKGTMIPGVFENILDKYPESTLVMFAGVGEPLVNPNFVKLAETAAERKKIINLVTNGVLLDEEKIKKIISTGRFNQVSVSLNAANAEDYNMICNMPEQIFNRVVDNIQTLVRLKKEHNASFEVIVSAVCSNEFLPKVKNFLKFVDALGVDRIDIHNYIDFSIKEDKDQWTSISSESEIEGKLLELKEFAKKSINAKVNLPKVFKKELFSKKCMWFFKNLAFDAYGNIGSCGRVMNPQPSYGNILKDNNDIWNNNYMTTLRKVFIDKKKKLPSCCYKCVENY